MSIVKFYCVHKSSFTTKKAQYKPAACRTIAGMIKKRKGRKMLQKQKKIKELD
jgi:hypothetical protein